MRNSYYLLIILLLFNSVIFSQSKSPSNLKIPYPVNYSTQYYGDGFKYVNLRSYNIRPDWYPVYQNFIGKIKKIKQSEFEAKLKFGEFQIGALKSFSIKYFNDKGNSIKICYYNSDSNLTAKIFFAYDNCEKLIEINVIRFDISDSNSDSLLLRKYIYLYNKDENLIEQTVYDTTNRISRKLKNKFDIYGNLIESNDYDLEGDLLSNSTYTIDEIGNYAENNSNKFYSEFLRFHHSSLYNAKGNIIEERINHKALNEILTLFLYDNSGNLTQIKFTYPNSKVANFIKDTAYSDIRYEYQYDEIGNWISQIKYTNEIPMECTKREIEYY